MAPSGILTFLKLFNPTSFVVATLSLLEGDEYGVPCIPTELPEGWTHLQSLCLKDILFEYFYTATFLPALVSQALTFELSRSFAPGVLRRLISDLTASLSKYFHRGGNYGSTGIFPDKVVNQVEIVVRSEEEKNYVETMFRFQAKKEVDRWSNQVDKDVEEFMSHVSVVVREMSV